MAYLMLGSVMILLSIVFRLAAVFRLTIPLLYALVVPTVFHEWYYANQTLANVIWYVLLAVVVLSWGSFPGSEGSGHSASAERGQDAGAYCAQPYAGSPNAWGTRTGWWI